MISQMVYWQLIELPCLDHLFTYIPKVLEKASYSLNPQTHKAHAVLNPSIFINISGRLQSMKSSQPIFP